MNELMIFDNEEFGQIRGIEIDGEPWFIASDACYVLGLTNTTMAMERLDDDEKSKFNLGLSGGDTNCINEYGLYRLIMATRKRNPTIDRFQRWVTHEVIPSIRKTGSYNLPQTYSEALRALADKAEEAERLALENAEMKPKAEFADAIIASTTTIYVGEFAKILKQNGIETGQNRFFKQLVEDHLLLKRNGQYEPTQYAMKLKLFEIDSKPVRIGDETQIKRTVKVTPQGQKYLINKYLGEREEILNDRHSEKFNTIYGNNETLSRSCI